MSTQRLQIRNFLRIVIAACLLLTATHTTALAQADTEEKNRRAVEAGFEKWRRGTGSIFELLASDVKWTITGLSAASGTYQSKRDFMDMVIIPFNARLSTPLVPTVQAIYADGDTVIVLWDGKGIARDGKSYENTYSWYLKMRDGKIVSATAFYDSIAFNDLWKRVRPQH